MTGTIPTPKRWRVGRIKYVAQVTLGKMLQGSDSGADVVAPYLRAANIQPDGALRLEDRKEMFFGEEELAVLDVRTGDVVVVEGGIGGFGRAAYIRHDLDGWGFQNSINRLRPYDGVDGRFLTYYLLAQRARGFIAAYCNIVSMPHLTAEKLAAMPVPIPPADEQRAIADYLDLELQRIDELIAKQQQLMVTLRERRIALVEDAIGGARRQGPTKHTGLSWAPVIPRHWEVGNIRRFAQMKTGHTPSRSRSEYWVDCTIPWFTLADVWQIRLDRGIEVSPDTTSKISEIGLQNSAAELLPAGTVMLSRTASVGFSGKMPVPMATSQDYWNWVCGPELLPDYLVMTFRAMRRQLRSVMTGSTHQTIYQPVAAAMTIVVPPLDEQQIILDHLHEQTATIDDLVAKVEQFVDVAQERRVALIAAAVTGQIDVRNAA